MKKKTRKRLLVLVWVLVALAALAVWFVPPRYAPPRAVWRAPVGFQVPSISLPDVSLSEALGEDVKEPAQQTDKHREQAAPSSKSGDVLPPRPVEGGAAPRIALLIDDMGLAQALSARAEALPAEVTLSYLPYAPKLQVQVAQAAKKGHEIMLHLPMEPIGKENPGPNALWTSMNDDQIRSTTAAALDSFSGYSGVNNHMGSRMTQDRNKMDVVVQLLRERGLSFVDSRTTPRSVALQAARAVGVPAAGRDIFLDDSQDPEAVQGELAKLEAVARRKGVALAIGHPHPVTLSALESWIPAAKAKGFHFVPVSAVVQ